MSQTIQERNLQFHFDSNVQVLKYDECAYYLNRKEPRRKAVDIICVSAISFTIAYYIEAKDFRTITKPPKPTNLRDIHVTAVAKYEDSKVGLQHLHTETQYSPDNDFAALALSAHDDILILHLEPHTQDTNFMFPKSVISQILQQTKKLLTQKQLLLDVKCLNAAETNQTLVPWTVTPLP